MATVCSPMREMLWVDDQIEKFEPWIQRFSENGVKVHRYSSIEEAAIEMNGARYDAILLDEMMPGGKGSHALTRIRTKAPQSPVFICSAYFYLDEVMDEINENERQSGFTVGRIDKTSLPLTDDPEAIAAFLSDIFEGPSAPERAVQEATEKLTNLTEAADIHWDDYSKLDMAGKLELHERVDEWTEVARGEWFSSGKTYLVFCGSWTRPIRARCDDEPFLSEQELVGLARDTGHAPFVYSVGGSVDDLTGNCSALNSMRGYPALRMERRGQREAGHFDTGNPLSLLSYEHYTMNGWIEPIHTIDTRLAGELKLRGKHHKLDNVIFTDSEATTKTGRLTAFSVITWSTYRFAARCLDDCRTVNRHESNDGLCYFRKALLGRSLGADLECEFQVSVATGAVRFRSAA